jgi:Tol biopolymer transport system component
MSPDGRKIAFIHFGGDDQSKISILSLNDFGVSQLPLDVFSINMISWSPDMKTILANVNIPQKLPVNQLIDADTGKLIKTISTPKEGPGSYPMSWSPDGSSFVFMSGEQPPKGSTIPPGQTTASQYFSLFTTSSSGSGKAVRLTNSFDCEDPVWTTNIQLPEGTKIRA